MILIKGGRVLDPKTGLNQIQDLILDNGKILRIGTGLSENKESYDQIIDASGLTIAPGLIDVHVHFRDPGFTHKEDIQTGARAAAAGGFTTVVCMANTKPAVDNIETLEYILAEGRKAPINVLTAANITIGLKGETLTGMEELKAHGACGFTDDGIPIMNSALVKLAMEEAVRLDVPLSFHEEDPALITNNGINQGAVSAELGLTGSPAAAEDTMIARDCMLALHTGATVDMQHISSGNSIKIIKLAKELGASVYAEVTPHHFSLNETALLEHGTLAKMNPPLRTENDRQAIIAGLKDGTIDIIATDHAPHTQEEKDKPLAEAPSGIIGLETALALGITHLVRPGHLSILQLIQKMTQNPAALYRLNKGSITEGADADLVIFDENALWTVDSFLSKSSNSPFIGDSLYGQVKYTICGGTIVYHHE